MKNLLKKIHPKQSLKELRWFDILILTAIIWGNSILTSTQMWIASLSATEVVDASVSSFSSSDDWWAIGNEVKLLVIALIYLFIRHFDFKQLKVKLHWNVLLWAPAIFLGAGFLCDLAFDVFDLFPSLTDNFTYLGYFPYYDWSISSVIEKFATLSPSRVLFSLMNGFYEEFYFLGLLLSTNKTYRPWILIFSTIVRISFHTYQGLQSALVIGVVFGLFYYFMYTRKNDNLLPFFLGHAFADMVGTSFFYLFVAG
ncbi:TPA: CPBP family glutamic-type intramembrane protease [Streptococcus suis]|nr:CPBP family intramembrane metalloprotease [Streptococcus suis]HEP1844326.1 CPBP family intramembrane metalloprotease [Streptococcus suis]